MIFPLARETDEGHELVRISIDRLGQQPPDRPRARKWFDVAANYLSSDVNQRGPHGTFNSWGRVQSSGCVVRLRGPCQPSDEEAVGPVPVRQHLREALRRRVRVGIEAVGQVVEREVVAAGKERRDLALVLLR